MLFWQNHFNLHESEFALWENKNICILSFLQDDYYADWLNVQTFKTICQCNPNKARLLVQDQHTFAFRKKSSSIHKAFKDNQINTFLEKLPKENTFKADTNYLRFSLPILIFSLTNSSTWLLSQPSVLSHTKGLYVHTSTGSLLY